MMSFMTPLTRWCLIILLFSPTVVSLASIPNRVSSDGMICRRDAFLVGPAAAVAAIATTLPRASQAASTETNGITSVPELLSRIRVVPTFCIVDPNGAAYMLVKQDERMAKGYAFTTFSGAKIVLEDAQKTATEKGYGEVWQDATITTIPADAAIRLSLTKKERFSQKDQSLDSILSIIPSAEDRADGLLMDKNKFKDQGKVPLFYIDQLDDDRTLLYFNKSELLVDWNRNHAGKLPPSPKVIDLLELFQSTIRGRTENLPKNIYFVPRQESLEKAKELKSQGLTPYKIDRMIV